MSDAWMQTCGPTDSFLIMNERNSGGGMPAEMGHAAAVMT